MRNGKSCNDVANTVPQINHPEQEGFITTLHPEGSFNNQIFIERKKREVKRPDINFLSAILNTLIPVILCIGICFIDIFTAIILLCIYVLIKLRLIIIWFIRIYQRYASEELRLSCVFEPTCSEYMILSLKKYGVIRGCVKGVKRLKRCHYPNGGEDYP